MKEEVCHEMVIQGSRGTFVTHILEQRQHKCLKLFAVMTEIFVLFLAIKT